MRSSVFGCGTCGVVLTFISEVLDASGLLHAVVLDATLPGGYPSNRCPVCQTSNWLSVPPVVTASSDVSTLPSEPVA